MWFGLSPRIHIHVRENTPGFALTTLLTTPSNGCIHSPRAVPAINTIRVINVRATRPVGRGGEGEREGRERGREGGKEGERGGRGGREGGREGGGEGRRGRERGGREGGGR